MVEAVEAQVKAALLGDNGTDEEGEGFDPFRRRGGRGSLGGAAARAARVVRASTGVAIAGLGGPAPTPTPGGPGGRPREPGDVQLV